MKTKKQLIKSWLLMMLMLIGVGGNLWAEEVIAYTLNPVSTTTNGYGENCDVTIDDITWNVNGNSQMTPWRIGGKGLSNTNRTVYSKTAILDEIVKVSLEVGAASNITVNSLKLIVASDASFTSVIEELSGGFSANSTITFNASTGKSWKNAYYKFVFNVTVNATSSNRFVEFKKATFYKEVSQSEVISVTGVSLDKTNTSIYVGDTETLTATVLPDDATNKNVTWESSDEHVATVTANGVVTGVAQGTATITVTSEDGEKTASCEVTVSPVAVTGVTLNESEISILEGNHAALTATIAPENATNKNVTWSSSNENVATIVNGFVTAVGEGVATITVTTVDGQKTASCEVTVSPFVQPTETEISLNDGFFGTNYNGSASGITDTNPESGFQDNVTVTYAGSGNHYINDSQIRFYPSNKLTFEAPAGYNITKIVFTSAGTWAATINANSGEYKSSEKTWKGEATSVIFTGSGSSRCDISKVTITLALPLSITAVANNNEYGNVSIADKVITATPAEGYRFANPVYSVNPEGAATVYQNGNQFTVDATADCTVQINFEAIPTHTVTWSINGETSEETFAEGAILSHSPVSDIEGKTFVGWTNSAIASEQTDAPEDLIVNPVMGTDNVTYYAVFAEGVSQKKDKALTITANTNNVPSSYGTANTFTEYTLEGVKFQIRQMYKNEGKLQWRAAGNSNGTGTMYNTDALSLKSVVLTYDSSDSNKNFTLKVGGTANPTEGTTITPSASGSTSTYDCSSANASYFVLTNGSGAGYLSSMTINYVVEEGSFTNYCTTVIKPVATFNGTGYASLQEALDAAEAAEPAVEDIVIDLLDDATLDITAWSGENNALSIGTVNTKSITINGNNHTLNFNQKNSDWNNVATMNDAETKLVLNDMTITSSGYNNGPWNRHDINFNCAVELNNVTSDKALAFKNDATLKNVTVTDNSGDIYGIWISPRKEGGQSISIDGLTVTCGRGIKVDDQYVDDPVLTNLDIKNATFNTTNKSAILVKNAGGTNITAGEGINIENAATDNTNLVWVDEDRVQDYYNVTVTGATMIPEKGEANYTAKIVSGEKIIGYFATLQAAFNAAEAGQTVTLLKDYVANESMAGGTRQFVINKSITFDGGGFTLTTKQRGIGIGNVNGDVTENIDVTIKNVTVLNTSDGARCIDTRGKIGSLTLEGVTLNTQGASSGYTQPLTIGGNQSDAATVTITNSTIQTNDDATAYYAIITFNPVNMNVTNSTIKGWANIYAKGKDGSAGSAGSVFNIDNCTLESSNAYSGVSNAFAAFVIGDNNVTINVTNSDIQINNTGDQWQTIVSDQGNTYTEGCVNLGEGNTIKFSGRSAFAYEGNSLAVSGGISNAPVPEEFCAEGMIPTANTNPETMEAYPYSVKVGQFVAQVGDVKYETFTDAVTAAENNTITLLANIADTYTLAEAQSLNVNLNGHTINVVAPEGYILQTSETEGVTTYSYAAPVAKIGETQFASLQAAVDAAQQLGGAQTINLLDNISGETVTIKEVANFQLTIDGKKDAESNYTVDAVIVVDGLRGNGGSTTNGASVTLQNIAFVKTTSTDGIQASHYPHHLTIQDCTYSGSDNDKWFLNASVDGPLYGVTVKNVTVEHARLIYANMADDAVFQNITATNDVKVGFNVKTSGTALIENCQVTTGKYAFRDYSDGYAGTFTLKDNTFISTSEESDEGVIVNRGGTVGTTHINVESGTYSGHIKVLNNKEGVLAISGGYFSEEVPQDYIVEGKVCVLAEDKPNYFTVSDPAPVAKIGETLFASLQAAVDAAQQLGGAQTINLLDNISGETVTIKEVANFQLTIDGKKDAESNYTVDAVIVVDGLRGNGGSTTNGASVTLQNIAFVKTTSTDGIQATHYPHHLTIQDCTYSGSDNDKWFLNASVDGPLYGVTVKNVTVEHARLIYANMADDAVFQNITATNDVKVGFNVKTSGTALIENCQVTTGKYAFRDYSDGYAGTFTLKDNTFISTSEESDEGVIVNRGGTVGTTHINVESGTYSGHIKVLNNKEGVLAISGGIFSEPVAEEFCAEGYICVANPDTETNEAYPYAVVPRPYVAQIGDVQYYSLADAVAAVPADGTETTITMIDNEMVNVVGYAITIPSTKNVVIDLNGFQVVGTAGEAGTSALIRNLGTLTIKDSSDTKKDGTGTGKLISGASPTWTWDGTDDYSGSYASNLIRNEKDLIVESGLLYTMSKGSAAYAIDNYSAGNITINGGKVDAAKASAIRMFYVNGGSITVNDGVVGHYNSDEDYSYMGIQVMSGTNVNVSVAGGTIAGSYALYANNTGGSIAISGGIFDGYVGIAAAVPNDILSISGGTFNEWVGTWGDQTKFISGGTYSMKPDAEYIADGYIAAQQGNVYVVIPESDMPSAPTIFHDEGTYEGTLDVAIAGQGTIMYKLGDSEAQAYSAPFEISETTKVTAWTEQDGIKSAEVSKTFTIVAKQAGPSVTDGYYNIKAGDKYVNVAGRKTVTLVDDNEGMPGTVIRVKATDGKVETLRSQGVDVPSYAQKAMNYVPEIVRLAVDKLHAEGAGELLGEHGLDAIMDKFDESFDYNLYLEKAGDAYRIYGRTPSMKPVVDFYAENKDNVDAKLPQLEAFINSAIDKVLEKTGGRGAGILVDFDLETVWQKMGGTLTEPVDEASTAKFYEEVLTSEGNVWNFAYQTAMIYWGNLKNNETFKNNLDKLGDYAKYIDKVENIQPNFKYYIVPSTSGVDFISEGNIAITDNDPSVAWTMGECTEFKVNFDVVQNHTVYSTNGGVLAEYSERYTTLYTDFAYTLPDGVKAYKVKSISDKGVAVREEITGTIPAQTPVMLINTDNANSTKALVLSTEDGTPVTGNLLVGADELINQYQLKTSQVENLFNLAKDVLGETAYNNYLSKYEHLMLTNAGTVNNKYFFGLSAEDIEKCVVKNENNEEDCVIRSLSTGDEKIGFYNNWTAGANQAFLISSLNPVKLWLVGDVNRDGSISIADVTALVNIILGKAIYPEDADEYDFEAANVNGDNIISIADVTKLVNMILGKE